MDNAKMAERIELWLLALIFLVVSKTEAATTLGSVAISPSPAFGTTTATNVDMTTGSAVTVATVSVTSGSSTVLTCNCKSSCALLGLLFCSSPSCATDVCTNPCGAVYTCTLVSTVPSTAMSKLSFSPSSTTSSATGNPTNICALKLNSPLDAADYDPVTYMVQATVTVDISSLSGGDTACNSGSKAKTGVYSFSVLPITTTTVTTTSIATTQPTTQPTTTQTTTTQTTTQPTTTQTTTQPTTTQPATSQPAATQPTTTQAVTTVAVTSTGFLNSPAGIGTIVAASILGGTLLIVPIVIVCGGPCCPCCSGCCNPSAKRKEQDPKPETEPDPESLYTIRNGSGYTFYNLYSTPPNQTIGSPGSNSVNMTYAKQSYPNSFDDPNFAKTRMTPINV